MSSFLQPFRMTLFQTLRMASFLTTQFDDLHHAVPIAEGLQALRSDPGKQFLKRKVSIKNSYFYNEEKDSGIFLSFPDRHRYDK